MCIRDRHFAVCTAAIGVLIYALTGLLPLFFGGRFLEYGKLPLPIHEAELHSIGTVSYTHLDVYKRQAEHIPYVGVLLKKNQDIDTLKGYRHVY